MTVEAPLETTYIPPDEIAERLLKMCIATIEEAIKARVDKDDRISSEQVRWFLPHGRGWINFHSSGAIQIQAMNCGDLWYMDGSAPLTIKALAKQARGLLGDWVKIKAAVKLSALF